MYFIVTASKDNYITDKIINSAFSASDANTGHASTIDIFRLYGESVLSGSDPTNELSRGLIKFDFDRIKKLRKTEIDLDNSSFNCQIELFDIMGGQVVPSNFKMMIFPLSQSFDEGIGKDISSFSDLDSSNFITASVVNGGVNPWHLSGANAQGNVDHTSATGYPTNIDIIVSGNLNDGLGMRGLGVSQYFKNGTENLRMDVTTIVSATVAGILPDCGWRLSYTGSQEKDTKTRFVKRFASRHVRKRPLRPRLNVSYDDTVIDQHGDFYFDLTGSLFLNNFHRSSPANILSGTSGVQITGSDCMLVTVRTGSFKKTISVSQHQAGTKYYNPVTSETYNYITGVYSASFVIPYSDPTIVVGNSSISNFAAASGSLTFEEYWSSLDGSQGYHTGSLTINTNPRTSFNGVERDIELIVTNAKSVYNMTEKATFRVFVREFSQGGKAYKLPFRLKSIVIGEAYWRVINIDSGKVIIPFKKANNGTRMSSDSDGMWFDLYMDSLYPGSNYTLEFLIVDRGAEVIKEAINLRFKVEE